MLFHMFARTTIRTGAAAMIGVSAYKITLCRVAVLLCARRMHCASNHTEAVHACALALS